jgi:NAD(P)-dependent dehydrogenase (short-subunit alcohol dehydrogenase family)
MPVNGTKTLLITGAGRGIGRATALLCAAQGWSVAVNYVNDAAAAQSTVDAVTAAGGRASALRADVTREQDVIALFDHAQANLGPLSGVVINAGIVAPSLPLAEAPISAHARPRAACRPIAAAVAARSFSSPPPPAA